jgi:aspartate aminotransferase
VLINSPNNPTGKIYGRKSLEELAAALSAHGKSCGRYPYLITDEPYREIAFEKEVPPVLCLYDYSIVVNSYSKSLSLPGERIGYAAVNPACPDLADVVAGIVYCTRVLGFVNAPALMQRCVARLTETKVDVATYKRRRDTFTKVLDEAGIKYAEPEGAFYIFARVPLRSGETEADDAAFSEHLKKYLILGVPGGSFGKRGWLRFAYCVNETLIAASGPAFKEAVISWR